MNRLQQAWIWLRRINRCRGFGIQSPADYRFVRYVVNEHWPYYAYATLGTSHPWLQRKLGRLYLRLANHCQPERIIDLVGASSYLQAGCRRATISHQLEGQAGLVITPPQADTQRLLSACHDSTILVVEDIAHHPDAWQAIASSQQATITFDLYYCGIALFTPGRTKQNYIVNF